MQLILCCGTDLRIKRIVLQAGIYINRLLDHPPEGSVLLGCGGGDDCRSVHLLLFFLLFGYFSGITTTNQSSIGHKRSAFEGSTNYRYYNLTWLNPPLTKFE